MHQTNSNKVATYIDILIIASLTSITRSTNYKIGYDSPGFKMCNQMQKQASMHVCNQKFDIKRSLEYEVDSIVAKYFIVFQNSY